VRGGEDRARRRAGLESGIDIAWGGLGRDELSALKAKLAEDAPVDEKDRDLDTWRFDLWSALGSCVDLDQDLVTLYS
jgi:hypothetical protein